MTTSTTDWVSLAKDLGPKLAPDARRHDEEGSFVFEAYRVLREHRFFSMAVPTELGGGGASYDQLAQVIRELGRHDGSTALAFSMHAHLVAAAVWKHRHAKPSEALLRRVAERELVLLSTGASDWVDSNGRMTKVDGGFEVDAVKIFGSGGPAADLMITSARFDDPESGAQVLHFSVPMDATGVSSRRDWDTMGMRGTGSDTLKLERVFVPDEAISLRRPAGRWHPAWSVVISVAPPLYMAAYVGIAEAAAERACQTARSKAHAPHLPYSIGELQNAKFASVELWRSMVARVREYDFMPELSRANAQLMSKTLVARSVLETVEKAMEVAGGGAYFRNSGLEHRLRDIHGAGYHPLPEKRQTHFTGRLALGLDPITGEALSERVF